MPHPSSASATAASSTRMVQVLALALFAIVVIQSAWLCDDAYITYRTIDNFVHGHGLRWNVAERVQAYTHPLWLMLLTPFYAVMRSAYFTGIAVSLLVSIAAAAFYVFGVARSWAAALLGVAVLISSRAFVDYSTSGLENPLTHLLLLAFAAMFLSTGGWADEEPDAFTPDHAGRLGFLAGLVILNRTDTFLLVLPALAWFVVRARPRAPVLRAMAIGFAPFILWTLFSLVYYGFPFPNTYYAKLRTGVSQPFLWSHGIAYVLNAVRTDRLVILVPLAALLVAWSRRRARELALVAGVALYGLYVVNIGGDFMSGRFFTAPLVLAVALLGSMDEPWNAPGHPAFTWALAIVVLIGLTVPRPTLTPDPPGYGVVGADALYDPSGVSDERGIYSPTTGLFVVRPSHLLPQHPLALKGLADGARGVRVSVQGSTGFYGYFAGPNVYVVDPLALSDPLLARLPVGVERPRTGHNERRIPLGYLASLESGKNEIVDPELARYYERLHRVVSGPLFDARRWGDIIALNLGGGIPGVDRALYRRPQAQQVEASLASDADGSDAWLGPADVPLGGASIHFARPAHRARVTLGIEARGAFRVSLLRSGATVYTLSGIETDGRGISWSTFSVPAGVAAAGYDGVQIEMLYVWREAKLELLRLSGPDVLDASAVHDLAVGPEGLWVEIPAGARFESARVLTVPAQELSVTLVAPNAPGQVMKLGPADEDRPGSGAHEIDVLRVPLGAAPEQLRIERAAPGKPLTVRAITLATSPPASQR